MPLPKMGDMKQLKPFAIAALTHQKSQQHSIAALTFVVGEIDANNSKRVQLLPDGQFKAADGRPEDVASGNWLIDEQSYQSILFAASQRKNKYHFDYEHQTLYTKNNGKPAIAAGWWSEFEYVPGEGLFALNVEWTPKASKHIADKEFLYVSAVFSYDKDGRVVEIFHAALTNDPALDGLNAVEALKARTSITQSTPTGETPMNEALKLLLGLLGVAHTDDDLSNAAALTAIQDKAKVAFTALKAKADKAGNLEQQLNTAQTSVTALKAQVKADGREVDLTQFVPKETYDAALTQLTALTAEHGQNSIEQLLKDNGDKVMACETDYLTQFGNQQGHAALKTMLDSRPAIAALTTNQTQDIENPKDKATGVAALSAEQKYAADQLDISHEDYAKALSADKGNK